MTNRSPLTDPGVRFPPPFLFLGGLLVGWLLDHYWRAMPLSGASRAALEGVGVALVIAGILVAAWGMLTFRSAQTAIIPHHSASQLVSTGPYRFTRNPMYLGLTIAYIGAAALLNSVWPVILLPIVLIVLAGSVISREERYLADAFGEEYAAYCARVRRWV